MHCFEQQRCKISIYVCWGNVYEITNTSMSNKIYEFKRTYNMTTHEEYDPCEVK